MLDLPPDSAASRSVIVPIAESRDLRSEAGDELGSLPRIRLVDIGHLQGLRGCQRPHRSTGRATTSPRVACKNIVTAIDALAAKTVTNDSGTGQPTAVTVTRAKILDMYGFQRAYRPQEP